jgi:glucose-6-phosphate 1-epimerase
VDGKLLSRLGMHSESDFLQGVELTGPVQTFVTFGAGTGGLPAVRVKSPVCEGEVLLHGAHVTRFTPAGMEPLLFVSDRAVFRDGAAVRGGVPVIFPWFGPRAGHPESPMHGLVRTRAWKLLRVAATAEGVVEVVLGIGDTAETRAHWDHSFRLELAVRFATDLGVRLTVLNSGAQAFRCETAFHPYFVVGDIRSVGVRGLLGVPYLSKTEGMARRVEDEEVVRFSGETDRVYCGTEGTCVIEEPGRPSVVLEKRGSRTTVVWNPWIAKAAAMADFGDAEWPGMVCVEQANVGDDALEVSAGQSVEMGAVYRFTGSSR